LPPLPLHVALGPLELEGNSERFEWNKRGEEKILWKKLENLKRGDDSLRIAKYGFYRC